MAKRQPNGITAEIERLLSVAVAPMTVGQIREALDMKYEAGEITAILYRMNLKVVYVPRTNMRGRAVVRAYMKCKYFEKFNSP